MAPDFELSDVRGGTVRLSDVLSRRNAALVFYRGGWCPICSRQLKELAQRHDAFQDRDLEILAISNEQPRLSRLRHHGLPFPVLVDPGSAVLVSYGLVVQRRDTLGWLLRKRDYAHPAVVLVRQDGRVWWRHRGANHRDRPSYDRILAAATEPIQSQLRLVSSHESLRDERLA